MSSTHQTAAEAKAGQIRAMGDQLGVLYHALWQEVVWVNLKWSQYVELFGTKESRVKLLNKAAPFFFRVVEDGLWEDVLLHIARLTDSPASAGKPNLSIRRLAECIDRPDAKQAVNELTAKALAASHFARDWRNRHIAHRDLARALELGADPLQPGSRETVRAALDAIGAVLNAVAVHYQEPATAFDYGSEPAGAHDLLYVIADGLDARQKRRARLLNGQYDPNDAGPKNL